MRTMMFSANVDPKADARQAMTQAGLAESLGYDGVLLQDHAYLARFAETWTLLTAIGATTDRVEVGANVLTSPFRLPAILAKQMATLDEITNGRAMLGLGVGANAQGIANWGGPEFTSKGDMYRAYRDALHIIRGLWESDDKEFSYQGDVQSVQDIEFGPVPKRRIPIMTGALGPQSLRLTAELADGISVSSSYVPVKNLPWFREQLDRGAVELGRNPQELFINFNIMGYIHDQGSSARPRKKGVFWGDVAWWKDRLAAIKAMGVSRFTYWPVHGDFNDQLRIFIEDVAPDLR